MRQQVKDKLNRGEKSDSVFKRLFEDTALRQKHQKELEFNLQRIKHKGKSFKGIEDELLKKGKEQQARLEHFRRSYIAKEYYSQYPILQMIQAKKEQRKQSKKMYRPRQVEIYIDLDENQTMLAKGT